MPDRVDADVVAAAVGGPPAKRRLGPHEAAMRRHHRQPRRLGHHRGVGPHAALEQRARAQALVLLVAHRGDDHLAGQIGAAGAHRRRAYRREARLHVRRSAAVDAAVALLGVERGVRHPVDADDVEMAVEHQRRPPAAADAGDDVRPAGRHLVHLHAKSRAAQHVGEQPRAGGLARRAGDQRRIAGVHAHEIARE
jgi:hypothetical protein